MLCILDPFRHEIRWCFAVSQAPVRSSFCICFLSDSGVFVLPVGFLDSPRSTWGFLGCPSAGGTIAFFHFSYGFCCAFWTSFRHEIRWCFAMSQATVRSSFCMCFLSDSGVFVLPVGGASRSLLEGSEVTVSPFPSKNSLFRLGHVQ